MDFVRATIVGVNFKNLEHPQTSQQLFAEVVLIDRTQQTVEPSLYTLKESDLKEENGILVRQGLAPIGRDSFSMIGVVESIDREKKLIRLRNQKNPAEAYSLQTVSYKHLIVASGVNGVLAPDQDEEEFTAGLSALMDALKLRENVPCSLSYLEQLQLIPPKKEHKYQQAPTEKDIERLVRMKMLESSSGNAGNRGSNFRKLYQVEIGS